MTGALLLVRLLLTATFALAGITKLADPAGTRKSILDFGAPAFLALPLALLLPWVELACAVALIPAGSAWWGAAGTLALLLLFIAGVGISLVRGRRPDCHCFGQLYSSPIGWKTIARNAVFSGMAVVILSQGRKNLAVSYIDWLGAISRFDAAVLAFTLVIATLAAFGIWSLFHLLRQNGRLLLRLEAVEAKLGITAPAPAAPGLPVDSPAPSFSLAGLDGAMVALDELRQGGSAILLLFIEPGCSACDALMPEVAQWQQEYADCLSVALISRGGVEPNRAKALQYNLRNVLLQSDREIAKAYRAEATPSAVLVKNGQIASSLAAGADAIRALVASATLPAPLKKGELAPALQLPDLGGDSVNLRDLRGHRTLLLFWNPSCGFCRQMLEDVKAWERNSLEAAPQLLIISTGSAEANRAEGFRSPMLLDRNFQAGQLFGAEGTPAAVMLDEEGRIASEVGVGAPAVLALASGTPSGSLG